MLLAHTSYHNVSGNKQKPQLTNFLLICAKCKSKTLQLSTSSVCAGLLPVEILRILREKLLIRLTVGTLGAELCELSASVLEKRRIVPGKAKLECSIDMESLLATLLFLRLMAACKPLRGARDSITIQMELFKWIVLQLHSALISHLEETTNEME